MASKDHYSFVCFLKDHRRLLFCSKCDSYGHLKSGRQKFTSLQKPIFSKQRRDSKTKVAEAKRSESKDSSENNSDSSEQGIESACKEVAMAAKHPYRKNKLVVNVIFENKQTPFRIDTGTDVSLMNEKSWVVLGKLKLSKNKQRLRNTSGNLMPFKETTSRTVR